VHNRSLAGIQTLRFEVSDIINRTHYLNLTLNVTLKTEQPGQATNLQLMISIGGVFIFGLPLISIIAITVYSQLKVQKVKKMEEDTQLAKMLDVK
jgi:hypothetical protein